ncbi:MAG: DUF692 domain-containing protein [Caldimonas sp.]
MTDAVPMRRPSAASSDIGIGLRQPHYEAVLEGRPALGFIEVHSENFFADGGAALAVLRQARASYPVSLHGVGLALGSAVGLDEDHLDRLERLVDRIEPVRVSDHASFARVARPDGSVVHGSDLLPIAFTDEALGILCRNVMQVQDRLRQPILVENLSAYLAFRDDAIAEPAFFAQLCARTGCSLLLDLNNLMVNALNRRDGDPLEQCRRFVDAIPPKVVGEIHLAGYSDATDLVIDDHGSRVRPDVWALFDHALRRFGPRPTLIEWDTALPPFDVLLGEAEQAASRVASRDAQVAA